MPKPRHIQRLRRAEIETKHTRSIEVRGAVVVAIFLLDGGKINPAQQPLAWIVEQRLLTPGINQDNAWVAVHQIGHDAV